VPAKSGYRQLPISGSRTLPKRRFQARIRELCWNQSSPHENHLSLAAFAVRPKDGLIGTRCYVPVGWQLEALWQPAKLKGFGNALLVGSAIVASTHQLITISKKWPPIRGGPLLSCFSTTCERTCAASRRTHRAVRFRSGEVRRRLRFPYLCLCRIDTCKMLCAINRGELRGFCTLRHWIHGILGTDPICHLQPSSKPNCNRITQPISRLDVYWMGDSVGLG
jgi:hypothetical protein